MLIAVSFNFLVDDISPVWHYKGEWYSDNKNDDKDIYYLNRTFHTTNTVVLLAIACRERVWSLSIHFMRRHPLRRSNSTAPQSTYMAGREATMCVLKAL